MSVDVQIWSDVVCPWCFVGKRRFEEAVRRFRDEGGEVTVTYRSHELSPTTPEHVEGDAAGHLARHLGVPREQAAAMQAQMAELAAGEGLAYDFAALRPANTLRAHQVLHLAREHGRQEALKERLLQAHFEQGLDVADVAVLADLAAEVGLDRDAVVTALRDQTYLAAVRADQAEGAGIGVRGVPFYVLDGRWGVSGAQAPETFLDALRQAASA